MTNLISTIFIVVMLISIVAVAVISFKSSNILWDLVSQYEEGLNLGCNSLEELSDKLISIGITDLIIKNQYIIVRQDKTKVKIYIKEGKVFVDVPKEGLAFSKIARLIGFLKKSEKLKKAVVANVIMDDLVRAYTTESLIEVEERYIKARKYSKIYKVLSGITAVLLALSIVLVFIVLTKDPVIYVKNGTFADYPDKEIGETFEAYFKNSMWREGEKTKDKNIVEFKGTFPFKDEDGKLIWVSMNFIKNNTSNIIDFGKMKINDKEIEDEARSMVLVKVIEGDKIEFSMETILDMIKGQDTLKENNVRQKEKKEKKEDKKKKKKEKSKKNKQEKIVKENDLPTETQKIVKQPSGNLEEYIIPDSDTRYLMDYDIFYMDKAMLRMARNEIYARYGRMFDSKDLQEYFSSKSWYVPSIPAKEFDESVLNEVEKYNLEVIKKVEKHAN